MIAVAIQPEQDILSYTTLILVAAPVVGFLLLVISVVLMSYVTLRFSLICPFLSLGACYENPLPLPLPLPESQLP